MARESKDDSIRSLSDSLNETENENKMLRQENNHWRKLLAMVVAQNGGAISITNKTMEDFTDDYQITSIMDPHNKRIAITVIET